MEICRAKKSDAESLAVIGTCVWIDSYLMDGLDSVVTDYIHSQFSIENMQRLIERNKVYVLRDDGVIGYVIVTLNDDQAEIDNFYILPRFQGNGFGRQLLSYLRNKHDNLWLRCWYKNERALQFYYANGFTKTGETYFELGDEKHKNEILTSTL